MTELFRVPGLEVESKAGMIFPGGTSAERSSTPKERETRVNTETGLIEVYLNGSWGTVGGGGFDASETILSDKQLLVGTIYPIDTSAASFRLTLPSAPKVDDEVAFFDLKGTWDSKPVTVTSPAKINNRLGDIVYGMKGGSIVMRYTSDGWVERHRTARADMRVIQWIKLTTVGPHTLTPDVGYVIDTTGLASAMEVRLPNGGLYDGATIALVDIGNNLSASPVRVNRNGGFLNGDAVDRIIYKNGSTIEMRHFAKGAERRWYLTVDTASGSAGEYVPTPVTGTGSTLAAGQAFFINTTAEVADSVLPASPQTGDFVIIVDFSKTFDSKPFTMKRAASGERIDGLAADYVHKHRGMAAKWVYSGDVTKGWVMESCANMWLPSIATTKAAATTHDLSFVGDSRTCTITVNGNTKINSVVGQTGHATGFHIVIKMDSNGGHNVTLPGIVQGWYPAVNSQDIDNRSNAISILQGSIIDGKVYYSVTQFKTS